MPYKKNYRKKNYRKRPAQNNVGNTLSGVARVAGTALSVAKFVASMINTEQKYHDTVGLATPGLTTPFVIPLCLIAQSLDNTGRIGRSIKGTYLNVKYNYFANVAIINSQVRCMVVQDLKHANAIMLPTELLTINSELGQRNVDFGSKFKVLYDKTHYMGSATQTGGHREIYIPAEKWKSAHLEYDGTGATVADISAFPLYFLTFSSNPAGTPVSVNYSIRFRYIDN